MNLPNNRVLIALAAMTQVPINFGIAIGEIAFTESLTQSLAECSRKRSVSVSGLEKTTAANI